MGLFSLLFGEPRNPPARAEMALLVEYANLVEGIGVEALVRGVDVKLLPADKNQLMEIMAKVSINSRTNTILNSDDLPKLYGALAFFFSPEELNLLNGARSIESNIQQGMAVPDDEVVIHTEGMALLSDAHNQLIAAKRDLKIHAASLCT